MASNQYKMKLRFVSGLSRSRQRQHGRVSQGIKVQVCPCCDFLNLRLPAIQMFSAGNYVCMYLFMDGWMDGRMDLRSGDCPICACVLICICFMDPGISGLVHELEYPQFNEHRLEFLCHERCQYAIPNNCQLNHPPLVGISSLLQGYRP